MRLRRAASWPDLATVGGDYAFSTRGLPQNYARRKLLRVVS